MLTEGLPQVGSLAELTRAAFYDELLINQVGGLGKISRDFKGSQQLKDLFLLE